MKKVITLLAMLIVFTITSLGQIKGIDLSDAIPYTEEMNPRDALNNWVYGADDKTIIFTHMFSFSPVGYKKSLEMIKSIMDANGKDIVEPYANDSYIPDGFDFHDYEDAFNRLVTGYALIDAYYMIGDFVINWDVGEDGIYIWLWGSKKSYSNGNKNPTEI